MVLVTLVGRSNLEKSVRRCHHTQVKLPRELLARAWHPILSSQKACLSSPWALVVAAACGRIGGGSPELVAGWGDNRRYS